jgi:hypothetical protein
MRNIKIILGVVFLVVLLGFLTKMRNAVHVDHSEQAQVHAALGPVLDPNPADPKREADCRKTLNDLNRSMYAFKSYQRDGEDVTVEVRDAYYVADFDAKRAFDAEIRCAVSEGRTRDQGITIVSYVDSRTHKDVAQWGKYTGFTVGD